MTGMIRLNKAVRMGPRSDTAMSLKQGRHSSRVYTLRDAPQRTSPMAAVAWDLQFSERIESKLCYLSNLVCGLLLPNL